MRVTRFAIIGAGLSGLYAAYLLERQGVRDYVVLEARERLGGRIATMAVSQTGIGTASEFDRFDLGPTWFWPDYQRELHRLIDELSLERFAQFESGDMLVERSPESPPARVRGYVTSPASIRLIGGMTALTDALQRRLAPERIVCGETVRRLHATPSRIVLESADTAGRLTTWHAEHVLLALPPRLAEHTITFEPALLQALSRQWRATATWMAPHAKYIAVYDMPFWRDQGLSGEARSARGPMGEVHDASMPGGSAALFGFLGIPARVRTQVAEDVLRTHCRAQFVRLFGPQAATPRAETFKDWAQDPYTATTADLEMLSHHAEAPDARAGSGPWQGRLTGIASEWSPQFPGYLAGAIEAARLGVQALAHRTASPAPSAEVPRGVA